MKPPVRAALAALALVLAPAAGWAQSAPARTAWGAPKLWTQPWTAALTMPPTDGPMFEYACHERNDGMTALLDIARGEEAAARGESGSP